MLPEYDYIIVGAGSAGCVVANRLSANKQNSVLLLEAGSKDRHPLIKIPMGFTQLSYNKKLSWIYFSEEEPELNNRKIMSARGRIMGGCSSINGMVYIRGQKQDYDDWAAQGNPGWRYQDCLPFFRKSENFDPEKVSNEYHGTDGPLNVTTLRYPFELCDAYIRAASTLGIPHNKDFNGATQEGVGYFHVTQKNGQRCSAADAFLKPILKSRKNLDLILKAFTTKIHLNDKRAVAVTFKKGDKEFTVRANKEIILCGGSFNTPVLLEHSGIGNKALLENYNIEVQHELPGVGENLQDHLTCAVTYNIKKGSTLNSEAKPLKLTKHLINYFFRRKGMMTLSAAMMGVFLKGKNDDRPNYQFHCSPGAGALDDNGNLVPAEAPGTSSSGCVLRPESRGSVHIKSNDTSAWPSIRYNYLSTAEDKRRMIEGIRLQRDIFSSPAFSQFCKSEAVPGIEVQSDEEILDYIRREAVSVYHPVGTCKMGPASDQMAVVNTQLKVHGIEALRVADASIMPTLISGNTNATCIMIGERVADFIVNETSPKQGTQTHSDITNLENNTITEPL